ncbi:hypothetical protein ES319_D05G352900v1 [Gossypium barbadense]|uniref:BTB domain-containing protein n=1 Tax=Gossypium barbadense TaxID=3634 RepID=A0A5J5RMN4_GOSBA|nr:hypothetical protein ES319_D05G352900v1 [Gossypium barbadense]
MIQRVFSFVGQTIKNSEEDRANFDYSFYFFGSKKICFYFYFCKGEAHPADILPVLEAPVPFASDNSNAPQPPPLPSKNCTRTKFSKRPLDDIVVPKETKDAWDNLFKEGYGADVCILTNEKSCVLAHSNVLSIASPVLANVLRLSKVKNGMRYIKIPGVPHGAVCMFIRFLYSSCYEEEELQKFVLHLLVLSHFYSIPSLKRVCICSLEQGWLTRENVIDVLQLARNCDAPRLAFICVRMVVKNFQSISLTEGWRAMRRANPALEQELVESVVEADTRKQERQRKMEEKKVYLQLHEAMRPSFTFARTAVGRLDLVVRCVLVIFQLVKGLKL